MENLSREELVEMYIKVTEQKRYCEIDLVETQKVLEDKKLDYMTIREYKNDIVNDELNITRHNETLKEIEKILSEKYFFQVYNEDGTNKITTFPENPLEKVWDELFPAGEYNSYCCIFEDSEIIFGEIPQEYLEVWEYFQKDIKYYHKEHNPKLYDSIYGNEKKNKIDII